MVNTAPSNNSPDPAARLHWTAYVMALLALVTLFLSEGQSFILPVLIGLLIVSAFARFRLGEASAPIWMLRIALFAIILVLDGLRPDDPLNNFFDMKLNWAGELIAADLVIQAWRRRPEGGERGVITLFWSGLVFLLACNTTQDIRRFPYLLFFAPAYILFALLSARHFRSAPDDEADAFTEGRDTDGKNRRSAASGEAARMERENRALAGRGGGWTRQIGYAVAVGVALTIGMGAHRTFYTYRIQLTYLGMRLFNEWQFVRLSGLSTTPHLGPTDRMKGSPERVARIEGELGSSHWRVMAFTKYAQGGWGPSRKERATAPLEATDTAPNAPARPRTIVTRLTTNANLLCVPLGAESFDPQDSGETTLAAAQGGPISAAGRAPSTYSLTAPALDADTRPVKPGPGLFTDAPNSVELAAMLNFPPDVKEEVKALALSLAPPTATPYARARAVEHYLLANYHYSLTYHPPSGEDPASAFILHKGAAHCEFFAAAAVILLRGQHIPARYVVGYYAHESVGPHTTVLRQRDAHAWAEAWLDGQGWLVIDGTPGDGRPDALAGPLPDWLRLREWFQDAWLRLLDTLRGPSGIKIGIALIVLTFAGLGWQWLRQTRRPQSEKRLPFRYASPGEELTALEARFERLCRSRGLLCPPSQTWQEYLDANAGANTTSVSAADADAARAFVRAYNAARFDPAAARETVFALASLLTPLEQHNT